MTVDREALQRLHDMGLPASRIAAELGCTMRTVYRWRHDQGLAEPTPEAWDPALLPGRLEQARRLLEDGASYKEVERTVHMDRRTLRKRFPGMGWPPDEGGRLGALITQLQRDTKRKVAA